MASDYPEPREMVSKDEEPSIDPYDALIDDEELSNCCGAPRMRMETDVCSDCMEHADFGEEEE